MDQRDDHNIEEEEDGDPIRLLDVKNRDNIWIESDEDHVLCDAIKSEKNQEEGEDNHNIDPYIFKPVTNNLPLSFYNNSGNLHLLQNCHNYTIPTVNCDRYKKISGNEDTSVFSDNTESMVDIKEEVVEEVVNDFDTNVMLRDDENKTVNEKDNVTFSDTKIILGSIKKDISVSKPNRKILSVQESMVIDCRKNKGLVGIKVKEYVSNNESSKLDTRENEGLVGKKMKQDMSKINNKEISKLEANTINGAIEFHRLNTNFTADNSETIGASVNKINNSNVDDELDMIKLPDQTTNTMDKTENDRVLIMQQKENNQSNRMNNLKATFDELNEFGDNTTDTIQSIGEKLKKIEAKKQEEEIITLSKTCDTNVFKVSDLQCPNIDTALKNKSRILEKNKLTLFKENINLNMDSNFTVNNMNSNTKKLNNPPNDLMNECTTMYKANETDKIQYSTNNNGQRVLEQKMSCPNNVANNEKAIESKYDFNTHNMLMHTEREVDIINNEWNTTGDACKTYHNLELPIQKQNVPAVTKFNQVRETTPINIYTNIHGKHGVYKENMHAIDNSVTNYQFTNSQSAVESSRSLAETQIPVFASGIGSEIKNKPMGQKILIAKNVDHDNKKLLARFQNTNGLISENSQKINSNMHNQNFDNVSTNSNATAPWPCRFNPGYNDYTTEYRNVEIGPAILKQRNELIRIHNKEIRNRAVDNRVAADNIIPQNANSVHNDATYSLMRNSLLNYNANIQKELDQTLNIQRQSYHTNASKNKIPRKVNAKRNYIPNSPRMCNRHANYNYNSNMTQLTRIKRIKNSTKRFYNQNFTDNVVQQFQSTHPPQYRNPSDTEPSGFNNIYCPVNLNPPLYNSPYIQDSRGNFFSDPKIPMIRTQYNNIIQQNYISQYHHMPNVLPYESNSSISHRNGHNTPLNLPTFQLPDISLQSPHFIHYSKPSSSVAPIMQSPISTLNPPLVKERVHTSVQPPVFPSMTIPMLSPVQAQPPVQAPVPQVVLSSVPATHSSVTIPATALGTASIETSLSTPTTEPKLTPLVATLPKPVQLPGWSTLRHLMPK